MIPAQIDVMAILDDLRAWGWRDFKIETVCGFSGGYVNQIRRGNVRELSYARAARLFNFWESEQALHVEQQGAALVPNRADSVTT